MWTSLLAVVAFAQDPVELPTGLGHCAETEGVWFHCAVKGGKVASVCGPADARTLHYRFGKPGAVEIELGGPPAEAGITFTYKTALRNEDWSLSFPKDAFEYVVSVGHTMGYRPDGSIDPGYASVQVFEHKGTLEQLVRLACSSVDVRGPFAALEGRVPATKAAPPPAAD